ERAVAADIDAVAGSDVAANFAENHDLAGVDVGCNYAVSSDGDAVTRQADRTFYPAVDIERLRSSDFALDHERLADRGLVRGCGGRAYRRTGGDGFIRHRRGRAWGRHGWTFRLGWPPGGLRL